MADRFLMKDARAVYTSAQVCQPLTSRRLRVMSKARAPRRRLKQVRYVNENNHTYNQNLFTQLTNIGRINKLANFYERTYKEQNKHRKLSL